MLVIKDGYGASATTEDLHRLLKKAVSRILHLSLWSLRIVSVLAYNYYSIDGEFPGPARKRFRDSRIDFHVRESAGAFPAQVIRGDLVDIQRNKFHRRMVMCSFPPVSLKKTVHNML